MKILHLIPNLSGGGAERQLNYLAPLLVNMGHEVHVAYYNRGPGNIVLPGVVLHQIQARSNYDPLVLWKLLRLKKKIKPNIIHTWILQMDIFGGLIAALTKTAWIIREPTTKDFYDNGWKSRIRHFLGGRADAIISNSHGGDEYWADNVSPKKRYIIQNGIPIADIRNAEALLPKSVSSISGKIILFVGRLSSAGSANKNIESLIRSFSVVKKNTNFSAVICGEGPQKQELERLVLELDLQQNVFFTGYLPAASVWTLMKKTAVYVSLSAYEGCPNSVIEAMACGIPLVLSDIPAHRELLDNNSALFVDPLNINQTAGSILLMLNDPHISRTFSDNAKDKAENMSIIHMAEKYEKIYRIVYE